VQANFCNLKDSQGRVIFSEAIAALPISEQLDWIEKEKAAGGTHYVCAVHTSYPGYFAPEIDFSNRIAEFVECLLRLTEAHLIPVVFLHTGDSYPGDTYFRELCTKIKLASPYLVQTCLWVCGWETVKGGYTSAQFNRCNLIMREVLGPEAILAYHSSQGRGTFASHPLEADDPWQGDEMGAWRSGCGPEFDVFLFQAECYREGEKDQYGQPAWWDRTLDIAERFLPAGTPMPGAKGVLGTGRDGQPFKRSGIAGVDGPDWFAGRKRPTLCLFEILAYHYIRGNCTDAYLKTVARQAQSFGFTSFGNGLP
jgi:hypothetical protein